MSTTCFCAWPVGKSIAGGDWPGHRHLLAHRGWPGWFTVDLDASMPGREGLGRVGDMAQATTLFDRHDQPAFTIFKEQRIEVPLSRGRADLTEGDPRDRGSAVLRASRRRRRPDRRRGPRQPARTAGARRAAARITQQLARQSFLTPRQDAAAQAAGAHSRGRARAALHQARRSSSCISTRCISATACYGVEAASRGYFGKHASELTLAEAALLAGLVKSPSSLRADGQPRARDRRAATSCCRRCSTPARSTPAAWQPPRRPKPSSAATRSATGRAARPVLQGAGAAGARRAVRLAARLSGRPARLLDHRHADAAAAEAAVADQLERRDRSATRAARRARGRDAPQPTTTDRRCRPRSSRSIRTRARARDGRRPRLRREPLQPRGAGAAAAGLGVQAVRLRRRARGGLSRRRP